MKRLVPSVIFLVFITSSVVFAQQPRPDIKMVSVTISDANESKLIFNRIQTPQPDGDASVEYSVMAVEPKSTKVRPVVIDANEAKVMIGKLVEIIEKYKFSVSDLAKQDGSGALTIDLIVGGQDGKRHLKLWVPKSDSSHAALKAIVEKFKH